MNDRLRFRAWKHHGEYSPNMFYMREPDCDGVVSFGLKNNTLYYDVEDVLWDERFFTPLQCTGLRDKNGELIFEGDVLLMDWGEDRIPPYNLGPVSWDGERGMWIANQLRPVQKDLSWVAEVIGNIYENPEIGASK